MGVRREAERESAKCNRTDKQRTQTETKCMSEMTKDKDVKTVISMQQNVPVPLIYAPLPPLYLSLCAVQIIIMEMTSV